MTAHADILDQRDSLGGAFVGAIALHGALVAGLLGYQWLQGHRESFGALDAGGAAVGIEAVSAIPLAHRGMQNPLANDTKSEVPQTPAKPQERVKQEKVSPDAIPLKTRTKKLPSQVASERQRFRPFEELDPNQVTAKEAPAISNPAFSALPGAGRVGTGINTTLGTRFAGYAQQIRQLIAQKWRTGDVDAQLQTAPTVIATFDITRNGTVRAVKILQRSGISSLDYSVERAILEANPLPPLPAGFERDSAQVELWFELKR
jgi:TonB family protein